MDDVHQAFAHIRLAPEWMPMFLAYLARLIYIMGIFLCKLWQAMHNSFHLHRSEFTEAYMFNPLVPQLDIRLDLESLFIHCCVHIGHVEDKHVTFSSYISNKMALILD